MTAPCSHISLGFTDERVPVGTHMCLVFTDDKERIDSILKFLLSGLVDGEQTACFSENITEDTIREYFAAHSISYDERKADGAVTLAGTGEIYFEDGVFNPEHMLKRLADFYNYARTNGYTAARVIGEMSPEIEHVPGGERLLEYESRVSMLVREQPVTAVCQYDARVFNGATIMDVLKVHPKMIVNGNVVHNPFFIEPEEYLSRG